LNIDATGKFVLIANYTGGSCAVFPIESDGRLGRSSDFVQHSGSSVNPQRQSAPHAHGIYLDPHNRFAFVPDLGLDKVLIYKFDAVRGLLEPNDPAFAAVAPGSGPRHFALHPNGKHAYVINEMLCTITLFACDLQRGALAPGQTVSTLRPGESVQRDWSTAELEIHPSGKFLYGSNRGHHTIAVFAVDPVTGNLTLLEHVATDKTPRGFGIDPSGRFLFVGGQDSDTASGFRIDAETGRLSPIAQTVEVGKPVCVKFYSN
jgi:6-phosphogluconolactonase